MTVLFTCRSCRLWNRPAITSIFSILLLIITTCNGAFTTVIKSGSKECHIIRVPRPVTISGNFDVLDDDLSPDPVSVTLENKQKILWSSSMGDTEGVFEVAVEKGGVHKFCMENGKLNPTKDRLDRTVGWAIRVKNTHTRSLREDEQGPDALRAEQLADVAAGLHEAWETLLDHYGFLKTREGYHNILSNQIMSRVVHWTVFEGITLALIAGAQILYLRKFMEKRTYL